MDIALLTGQRPADVLKLQCADIRDGALFVAQSKTGAKRAIEIVGELATVIARIASRARVRRSTFLIQNDNGRPLSMLGMRGRFDKCAQGRWRGLPVPRHPRQDRQRHRRSRALTGTAGAQEPGYDGALRAGAHRAASETAPITRQHHDHFNNQEHQGDGAGAGPLGWTAPGVAADALEPAADNEPFSCSAISCESNACSGARSSVPLAAQASACCNAATYCARSRTINSGRIVVPGSHRPAFRQSTK